MLEHPRTKLIMAITAVGAWWPWEGTGIRVRASAGSLCLCALKLPSITAAGPRTLQGHYLLAGVQAGTGVGKQWQGCGDEWSMVSPAKSRVIQQAFSKNCNQQAVQEQNCEALEAVTRLWYKCMVVGCVRVDKHQSATKNTFTEWKAAATFVPQPKDNSHANCKSTLTGPACSKNTKADQDVKKERL